MLARIRKSAEEKDQGFTLIELLVVMIIIGILAAIAIPVFLSQRAKARDTSTKADVSTIGKEIATYWVEPTAATDLVVSQVGVAGTDIVVKNGTATVATVRVSSGTLLKGQAGLATATSPTDSSWCVGLTNVSGSNKDYKYSATTGLLAGTC